MKMGEAVKNGFKFFKVKTNECTIYLELVDEFKTFNVKSHSTGNIINVRENYEITPIKNKPSAGQMNKEDPYRSVSANVKVERAVPSSGADIPEVIGKRKSNKTEGPTFREIISNNIKKIKTKEDVGRILKSNGLELSSSSIRYGWFLRQQILKGEDDYYGHDAREKRRQKGRK